MTKQESLYERVGGYDAVYAFLEDVIARLMDDEETGVIWNHMSEDRVFEEHQNGVDYFCQRWGGPQTYRGRDMITVHKGMGVTERHWAIFLEKIGQAFDKFDVAQDLRTEILTFIEAHKPQVVGSPSFRDVVKGPDGQKFTGGMESFGVKWP